MSNSPIEKNIMSAANCVAEKLKADVLLYNGPIQRFVDKDLIAECIARRKREKVLLILVTTGGDPDAAYRISRCLQMQYKDFMLYVSGYCKSAGTLVAVGAHSLIVSDHGELGPLDVQMPKQDDLWERQSGLTVMGIIETLQREAVKTFHKIFENLNTMSPGSITLQTAAEIASRMTAGLYASLYSQVDPLHVGEAGRAMRVSMVYGTNLLTIGGNITPDKLVRIMFGYPSHSFVIDRGEADELFINVREPDDLETALAETLGDEARIPAFGQRSDNSPFRFLSSEVSSQESEQANPL